MPVPSVITDLSTTAVSNSPAGTDNVFPDLDNYLRALSAFLASIRDNSGNGWVSPYLAAANPSYTGTLTGGTGVVALGTNQFYKDASGNVGIGTSSPGQKLDVNGSGRFAGVMTASYASGFDNTYISQNGATGNGCVMATLNFAQTVYQPITYDASYYVWRPGGTEHLRLDASGNLRITGTGGLGYGTGSGGAVTQITSRTTGVALNKTNGAITLVSAAGTATWQSFTVTNSTVAATDTVIVSQKAGTDLNQIFVTAVAAGSFRISFATTGGTTTEQPVFNFAVIKAVTA